MDYNLQIVQVTELAVTKHPLFTSTLAVIVLSLTLSLSFSISGVHIMLSISLCNSITTHSITLDTFVGSTEGKGGGEGESLESWPVLGAYPPCILQVAMKTLYNEVGDIMSRCVSPFRYIARAIS